MVDTICYFQSDQRLHYLLFSAVWVCSICHSLCVVLSRSTLCAILSIVIRVYITCYSQQADQGQGLYCHSEEQSDQGLHYLPFSAVWSGTTLFAILSSLIKVKVHFVILRNSLVRVYTICHSLQSDQRILFPILSYLIRVYIICHSQSDQGLHCLPFSAVWWVSTLFAILSSPIWVYTVCHSQQPDQGLHYLPFSVLSGSTVFAILSSLIKEYTICHSF